MQKYTPCRCKQDGIIPDLHIMNITHSLMCQGKRGLETRSTYWDEVERTSVLTPVLVACNMQEW